MEVSKWSNEQFAPPPTPAREAPGNQSWKSNFLAIRASFAEFRQGTRPAFLSLEFYTFSVVKLPDPALGCVSLRFNSPVFAGFVDSHLNLPDSGSGE
jgi:hypothetical protein